MQMVPRDACTASTAASGASTSHAAGGSRLTTQAPWLCNTCNTRCSSLLAPVPVQLLPPAALAALLGASEEAAPELMLLVLLLLPIPQASRSASTSCGAGPSAAAPSSPLP